MISPPPAASDVPRSRRKAFRVVVQIDDRAHYSNTDLAARYVVQQSWRNGPHKVIERIAARL